MIYKTLDGVPSSSPPLSIFDLIFHSVTGTLATLIFPERSTHTLASDTLHWSVALPESLFSQTLNHLLPHLLQVLVQTYLFKENFPDHCI